VNFCIQTLYVRLIQSHSSMQIPSWAPYVATAVNEKLNIRYACLIHYFAFYRKHVWKTCQGTAFLPCGLLSFILCQLWQ